MNNKKYKPRLIAIELTSNCNLKCKHCRMTQKNNYENIELTKNEIIKLFDELCIFGSPIVILSGGEPLLKSFIFDIIKYGISIGLNVVLATNGTLINKEIALKLKSSGIKRVSVSIDGTKELHNEFRCIDNCFERAIEGINFLKEENIEFQINTTISKHNFKYLDEIYRFSCDIGAVALHFFFLVPTGRGNNISHYELSPEEYEDTLKWIYHKSKENYIYIHPTCAPQYSRIKYNLDNKDTLLNKKNNIFNRYTKGCLGGSSFVFISCIGDVNPCGYLPVSAGNIRKNSFIDIWNNSKLFKELRDSSNLKGKCGSCQYKNICGGCRARAYSINGDYLSEEPFCIYK